MTSRPVCSLTSDPGYVIYSACGSFWVPMLSMVVFYWKIYKTAVAATEAYKRGFVEPKTSGLSSSTSENALCNPLSRADADYFARLRRFSVRGSSSAVASRTDSDVSDERGGFPRLSGGGVPRGERPLHATYSPRRLERQHAAAPLQRLSLGAATSPN